VRIYCETTKFVQIRKHGESMKFHVKSWNGKSTCDSQNVALFVINLEVHVVTTRPWRVKYGVWR